MRRRRLALAAAGLLLPGLPTVSATESTPERLVAAFKESCLAAERPELKGTGTWRWIEELCAREAEARARAFAGLDHAGRLGELGRDCERWHAANRWRLPPDLQEDPRARAGYIAAACAAEAEERLRALER